MQSGQVTQVIDPPGPLVGQAGRMSNKRKVKRELKAKWTEMSKAIGESSRYMLPRDMLQVGSILLECSINF